ncbi:hypothetical protein PACC40_73 [Mycobacterium phage Pacc40]|uniref:Uncharacterized protein n=1 Tax=Mycobacterium phage Pacc40 TaxID=2914019 RepID=B5U5B9_9CAUD|nr:gp73 [Mycobacterium phage Pacc40]ACI12584.1 hypothetical protein PACC40_73 [Mycobacterium phage Pacc40]
MSGEAQNVIAEAIGSHRYDISDVHVHRCVCGKDIGRADDALDMHRAEEVDKALGGLTRETLPAREGWILPPGWIGDRAAARWVSGWSEA